VHVPILCSSVQFLVESGAQIRDAHLEALNDKNVVEVDEDGVRRTEGYVSRMCQVIQILLERGADVNMKMSADVTLLHLAIEWTHPLLVSLILEHGANVHARDFAGESPRDLALRMRGSYEENTVGLAEAEVHTKLASMTEIV